MAGMVEAIRRMERAGFRLEVVDGGTLRVSPAERLTPVQVDWLRRHKAALVAHLTAAGFTMDTDGQRLKVSPSMLLTPAQRDWLLRHKPALVEALAAVSGRWCIEYPRSAAAADSGTRLMVDYSPAADWRRVSTEYPGAAVWPAPDGLDVATWIAAGEIKE